MSLRARLLVGMVVLVAAGLTAAAAVTYAEQRSFLLDHVDGQVPAALHRLIAVELLVGGAVILALVALGWVVIRIGLRPLERIGRAASEITHSDLSRRVPDAGPTEVNRLGRSLNEMLGQIETAFSDRSRSEARLRRFATDASHELRTPLAAIRGYAELFRLGAVSDRETLAHAMARIEAEATRMGVLVEDLLALAQLDHRPEPRRDPVDVGALAREAALDARVAARGSGPERVITVHAAEGPEAERASADPDRLRQVLANLLRNAVIHTPAGTSIEIEVWRDGDHVVLSVRDHGPGLPAGDPEQLFQRFWRQEGGRRRGPGGAGLGLAIVRAIVEAHGGTVSAQTARDGGAVFTVALLAAAVAGHTAGAAAGQTGPSSATSQETLSLLTPGS